MDYSTDGKLVSVSAYIDNIFCTSINSPGVLNPFSDKGKSFLGVTSVLIKMDGY